MEAEISSDARQGKGWSEKIKIVELEKDNVSSLKLKYRYVTSNYYDLSISREAVSWKIELTLKHLEKIVEKEDESKLFEPCVEEPRVFAAKMDGEHIGWIELGYHKWNNRMRVWEFLVKEEFRRRGIGTLLMKQAVKVAKEKGARMLVLESQTCNRFLSEFWIQTDWF